MAGSGCAGILLELELQDRRETGRHAIREASLEIFYTQRIFQRLYDGVHRFGG